MHACTQCVGRYVCPYVYTVCLYEYLSHGAKEKTLAANRGFYRAGKRPNIQSPYTEYRGIKRKIEEKKETEEEEGEEEQGKDDKMVLSHGFVLRNAR